MLSADPLLVLTGEKLADRHGWRVEPGNGKEDPGTHSVAIAQGAVANSCPDATFRSSGLAVCDQLVVGDGVVHLRESLDENNRKHGIVAMDLEAGEELWHTRAEGEASLSPITVEEDRRPIAYQDQTDASAAAVMALGKEDGTLTALAALPSVEPGEPGKNMIENGSLGDDTLTWHDGVLAFVTPAVVVRRGLGRHPRPHLRPPPAIASSWMPVVGRCRSWRRGESNP